MLWTYADRNADGSYRRVGGGAYDAASNTYGQGAFNADDIARAAVVYVRHWRADRLGGSRGARVRAPPRPRVSAVAQRQRRAVDAAGRHAEPERRARGAAGPVRFRGVVLAGADGLGVRRGLPRVRNGTTPRSRGSSATASNWRLRALDREVLSKYPQTQVVDGRNVPAWLIVDGADATAEAMLGLPRTSTPAVPRRAPARWRSFAEGVAALGTPAGNEWPYGAVLPWALSRSIWHALGVADAGRARPRPATLLGPPSRTRRRSPRTCWSRPGRRTAGTPRRATGRRSPTAPIRGCSRCSRSPARRGDRGCGGSPGIAGSWYFGNNPAGTRDVRPRHRRDVRRRVGRRRRSTATAARSRRSTGCCRCSRSTRRRTWRRRRASRSRRPATRGRLLEAESATLLGGASVVTARRTAWTGESGWSGGAYVQMPAGARVAFPAQGEPGLVEPVALRTADRSGRVHEVEPARRPRAR